MDSKPDKQDREPTRGERRKAALRANLAKRKEQARARDAATEKEKQEG